MKKIILRIAMTVGVAFMLLPLVLSLLFMSSSAKADFEITYFVVSEHFSSTPFNQYDHQFIGLEKREGNSGWSIATFKNSYFKRSVMATYTRYWQLSEHFEANLMLGAVTGYKDQNSCPAVCPVLSPGITYTKYKYFRPRLSVMGTALTLSFSARF